MPEYGPTFLQGRDFPNLVREQRVGVRYTYAIKEEKRCEDEIRDMGYTSD